MMAELSQREKCTILLSTHHLEDAEKLCKRVLIMNKGHCLLIGTPDELRQKISQKSVIEVTLKQVAPKLLTALRANRIAEEVTQQENKLLITVKDANAATPAIVRTVVGAEGEILSVNAVRPSLEEAYLKLIKGGETQ